jgi:PPOX class probable F420-dependent enzyme
VELAMMRRRLAQARVGHLATTTADDRPHVVPVCFALVGEEIVSAIDRKPKTTTQLRRLDNVRAHPEACLIVDHWDEDWTRLWWVRVDGPARVLEPGAELDDLLGALHDKYRANYGMQRPDGPAIVLRAERWGGWAADDSSAR